MNATSTQFQILEFFEEDYVLYLDDEEGGVVSRDRPEDVERYLTLFWKMESLATAPADVNSFIDGLMPDA